jgi:hypothetical protein
MWHGPRSSPAKADLQPHPARPIRLHRAPEQLQDGTSITVQDLHSRPGIGRVDLETQPDEIGGVPDAEADVADDQERAGGTVRVDLNRVTGEVRPDSGDDLRRQPESAWSRVVVRSDCRNSRCSWTSISSVSHLAYVITLAADARSGSQTSPSPFAACPFVTTRPAKGDGEIDHGSACTKSGDSFGQPRLVANFRQCLHERCPHDCSRCRGCCRNQPCAGSCPVRSRLETGQE